MNDEHRSPDFEDLEPPLAAAVKAALAESIPEYAIERVKARAKQLATTTVSPSSASSLGNRSWRASRSVVTGLTAIAAMLAIAIGVWWSLIHSSGPAFAQMMEKVKAVTSVRFTTATRFGKGPEISGVMYLDGNRVRFEQFDAMLIQVADLDRKQALILDTHRKLAQTMPIDADAAQYFAQFGNPIDQLRRVKTDDAKQMGEEIVKGRRTQVYRLPKADLLEIKQSKGSEMLVWVDVESGLPAKIVIRDPDPKSLTEFRFEEFIWNEPLDARLFSLAIPDGFQTGTVAKTPSPKKPTHPNVPPADNPHYLADGILSRDRVPARIIWDPQGKTITALMRDPESVQGLEREQNELRQWDVATGEMRWSAKVAGAGELAMTADGKTLAIVIGYEVQMRDAASGNVTREWPTDEHLLPLAFSPDGKTLAAGIAKWGRSGGKGGKEYGGAQFWDVERASLVRSISDDKPVTFIRYSVDGKCLATSSNGPVKLWEVATGKLTRIFPGRSKADFSPDGETIACVSTVPSDDKTIGRVDLCALQNGSVVKSLASGKGTSASWLLSVAFSPNGRLLAAADWNGVVTLWDVATGARKQTITDHQAGVLSAVFAPDGATLATGSEDKTLRLRKLPAGLTRRVPEQL